MPPAPPPPALPTTPAHALSGHEGAVLAVRFNGAGTYCLSCGKDRTLRLWNPHRGVAVKTYSGHGYDVRDVVVSADNARLTSVGGDRTVFHWDVASGTIVRRWRGHDEGPPGAGCVAAGPGDAVYVTGGADTTARVWDARSRSDAAVAVLRGARDSVTGVAVPGVGSDTSGAALLTPPGGPSVSRPTGAPAAPSTTPSAHEIVTSSVDGSLRRYDIRAGQLTADAVGSPISSLALTRADRGAAALVACLDGRLRLVDGQTGALLASYTGHVAAGGVKTDCLVLPPRDAAVAVGSEDGCVVSWDLSSEALTDRLTAVPSPRPITSVAVHPVDGKTMVTASTDGVVRVWV